MRWHRTQNISKCWILFTEWFGNGSFPFVFKSFDWFRCQTYYNHETIDHNYYYYYSWPDYYSIEISIFRFFGKRSNKDNSVSGWALEYKLYTMDFFQDGDTNDPKKRIWFGLDIPQFLRTTNCIYIQIFKTTEMYLFVAVHESGTVSLHIIFSGNDGRLVFCDRTSPRRNRYSIVMIIHTPHQPTVDRLYQQREARRARGFIIVRWSGMLPKRIYILVFGIFYSPF